VTAVRAATTTSKETVEIREVPDPVAGPGEALVRVEHVTLCGTDLHIWEDDYATELPIVQGHELAGTVVALGSATAAADGRPVTVGDRVAVSPMVTCGSCYACSVGRGNACRSMSVYGCYEDGALADLMAVPTSKLHRVPDALSTETAALAEPVSIAMQAVRRGRAQVGERVLVLGCGPIGLLATLYLADLGSEVWAADVVASRRALAEAFGARATLEVGTGFPTGAQRAGLAAWTDNNGPVLVIDATGVPESLVTALDLVTTAGRVVQVGISDRQVTLSMRTLPVKEVDLLGSRNSTDLIGEALELLSRHPREAERLITHRFNLVDLGTAFDTMRDRTQEVGKVAIRVGGRS